jgi:hypothetical protein
VDVGGVAVDAQVAGSGDDLVEVHGCLSVWSAVPIT